MRSLWSMKKLTGAAAIAVAIAFVGVGPAQAADGQNIGKAELSGSAQYPDSSGRATLQILPKHAQIDLERLHGLPRERGVFFVVWLATGKDQGYVGGAFPRSSAPLGLDAIVPGRKVISHRNTRAADRLVITVLSKKRTRQLARDEERAGWSRHVDILGERVMRGAISP